MLSNINNRRSKMFWKKKPATKELPKPKVEKLPGPKQIPGLVGKASYS